VQNAKRLLPAELVETSIRRQEGKLLDNGALCAQTGKFTGRSPKDKYFVGSGLPGLPIDAHQWLTEEQFEHVYRKVTNHLERTGSFVFDGAVNQHPKYQVPVRFYTEFAWHNLFVQQLFLTGNPSVEPTYTVYGAPTLQANPDADGTRSETFIIIHPTKRIVLIGGTEYAGELKKSIFTLMHHHLATQDVMPMHCSASVGDAGDVALFFGLSGTGKTTLSADPLRKLIGDDEHGWADDGVFNMENGCYAKCIDLNEGKEPDIFRAIRFGAVLENVVADDAHHPLYSDSSLTENTRAAYPLTFIRNVESSGRGGHPEVIVFLSADASGVLPAVSKLSPEDARKHYLLGYTSKLAGTERGVVHPEATFSACFGSPFLTDYPIRYADMLMERVQRYNVSVFLLSTGWVAGGYGETQRMPLNLTRDIVSLVVAGELNHVQTRRDESLFLDVPMEITGIPAKYLNVRSGFADGAKYEQAHTALATSFAMTLKKYNGVTV